MKKTLKTIVSAVLVLALALAAIPAFAEKGAPVMPHEVNGNTFTNEYIAFNVNNYGGVSWYENANGDDLLYDRTSSTSFTTIRVDGQSYKYDNVTKTVNPAFEGETNYSAAQVNGVLVEQRLTPVENDLGHKSIVEWHYTYTNTTDAAINVGCRIMLDTCLGSSAGDGAPYRVPGNDSVTTEQMFYGAEIPGYWFTYYQDITAQGTFASNNMPDQFQISQWSSIYNTVWNYNNTYGYTMSDTSCAATWYEAPLQPGETREYVMYYGIGELNQEQNGQLAITLNGNHSVAVNADGTGYEPNPVSMMGILANVGNGPLTGVYAYVELPEGLSFADGTESAFLVGDLAAAEDAQNTWYIMINETSTEDRTFMIPVHYGCDGTEDAIVYFELFVPGVAAEELLPPTIEGLRAELRNRNANDTKVDLRFVFQVNFNDSFVEYKGTVYGPAQAFEVTNFYTVLNANGRAVTVAGNNIFEMYNDNFTFTAVLKGMRPANFGAMVTAVGYLEYVKLANGELGYDNTADEPIVACVNDLL